MLTLSVFFHGRFRIFRLTRAGLRSIEAGAFVSPRWVPQMADSAEVLRNVARSENVTYSALVPNLTGETAILEEGKHSLFVTLHIFACFFFRAIDFLARIAPRRV